MRRILLIAVSAVLLAPQAARAATLDPLNPCYRSVDSATRESVAVLARDFTPGAKADVFLDGQLAADNVDVLLDGTVSGAIRAPYRASGERAFTITVTEQDKPANTVMAASRVTALAMRLKPSKARPSKKVRFIGRGFTDNGGLVYGHYVRGGKVRKTVTLGAAEGPCGTIDVKRRQIPLSKPKTGRWTLQVDNYPEYSPQPAGVFVRLAITVRRVLGSQTRR